MSMEITKPGELLTDRGELVQVGWARKLFLSYRRDRVRAGKLRIKEWDFFEIRNPDYGIVLLIFDVGYLAKIQVTWIDFRAQKFEPITENVWFSLGSMNLPPGADEGNISFSQNGAFWEHCWDKIEHKRKFKFDFPKFREGKGISGEISLYQPPEMDTMVNTIPFKRKNQFVYAQKITCMVPEGTVNVAGEEFEFSEQNNSFGLLDWSRGVFPYYGTWRWSIASGKVGGNYLGLQVGYGFSGGNKKSMIFYNHRGHHLDNVRFTYDNNYPMKEWVFESNDNRVNLTLTPFCIERSGINFIVLRTKVLKVFGFFTGELVLDDGTVIKVTEKDRFFGSAEAVVNRW